MKCNYYTTSWASSCLATIFVVSFYIVTCDFAPTFEFVFMTSSSTNLFCGSTSSGCICDCFASVAKVASIYSCSHY